MIQTVKKMEKEAIKSRYFDFIKLALCRPMKIDVGANNVSKTDLIVVGTGIASTAIFFIIQGVVL